MAVAAHSFTHFDLTLAKGDELDDAHPLVESAPHLFVQPDPVDELDIVPVRIRGPLVETPKTSKTKEA